MRVKGIDYTYFAVSSMPRALDFYRDLLRLPLARLILEDTWAEFELDPGTLVIGHGDSFTLPGGGMVALAVYDVEAAVAEVKRAGAKATDVAIAISGDAAITKVIQMPSSLSERDLEGQVEIQADQYIP